MLFLWVIFAFSVCVIRQFNALTPEECQKLTKDKHCIIEYAARERWPHHNRYFYSWYSRKCFLMRWSDWCPIPEGGQNNFPSEAECLSECSGWA